MAVMCATAKVNKVKEKRSADKRREEKRREGATKITWPVAAAVASSS